MTQKKAPKKAAKKSATSTKKSAKKSVKKVAKKAVKKAAPKKSVKKVAKKAAKKAVKKAVPKKADNATKPAKTAKKASTKFSINVYDVQDVPHEQHFFFVNGHRVKNVKELAEVMDRIEQEVFEYHVNEEKNDFFNWVKHVFEDIELAEKLVGVTGPKHLQFTIYKHVADKALKKKR
jgi:hypothetical protein